MTRRLPIIVAAVAATFMLLELFFSGSLLIAAKGYLTDLAIVIGACIAILALGELVVREARKLTAPGGGGQRLERVAFLAALLAMLGFGILGGKQQAGFVWLFDHLYAPLQSSMLALLAFFLMHGGLRALRNRPRELSLLLLVALLVMLGRTAIGHSWFAGLFSFEQWLFAVPNVAAKRALLLGAGVGILLAGLRTAAGLDGNIIRGGR